MRRYEFQQIELRKHDNAGTYDCFAKDGGHYVGQIFYHTDADVWLFDTQNVQAYLNGTLLRNISGAMRDIEDGTLKEID